jgi:hypothetical protein
VAVELVKKPSFPRKGICVTDWIDENSNEIGPADHW